MYSSTDEQRVQDCGALGCDETTGTCNACSSHASFGCQYSTQDIYWKDSCGNWEGIKEDCQAGDYDGAWATNYCKDGNVFHSRTEYRGGCAIMATSCSITETTYDDLVETCTNGCTAGGCNAGCSDDAACTSAGATGCSFDFVKRWWCETGGDGCLDQTWETCTGGRCDAGSHQCVAGCTSDAACNDNNPCTQDLCTDSVCSNPADMNANGATCDDPSHDGIGDGRCADGVCACHDVSTDSAVCDLWTCGSRIDFCGIARTCLPGCTDPDVCNEGSCSPSCTGSQTLCDDQCVDLTNDPSNCGNCGFTCPTTAANCVGGDCIACTSAADCDDKNDCTFDTCAGGECAYENNNLACMLPEGSGYCDGGMCLLDCITPNFCAANQPSHSSIVNALFCVDPLSCYLCDNGYSWDGGRCVSTCIDECDLDSVGCDATTPWICGEANDGDTCLDKVMSDACSGNEPYCQVGGCVACRTSADCAWDEVCDPTSYVCEVAAITVVPNPGDITVTAGTSFTITFTPNPDSSSLKVRSTGWPVALILPERTLSYTPSNTEIGTQTVQVEVFLPAGIGDEEVKGAAQVPVIVQCNPDSRDYGPCCEGDGGYKPDESSCTHTNSEEGETWWCQDGECIEYCSPGETQCKDDQVWRYDTCDDPIEMISDCPHNGLICVEDPGAQCVDPPTSCTGEFEYECRGQDGVQIDAGCGIVETIQTCPTDSECVASENGVTCQPRGPCYAYPGTILCGGRCIDPLSSRTDCGNCNHDCDRNEQCVEGSCALIPGCTVICDQNDDCGEGYVCVQAGSCTESRCDPINILEQNQSEVSYLAGLLTNGMVQVESSLRGNTFTFDVTNLGPTILENVSIIVDVKKAVAASASSLKIRGAEYEVLEDDPVLRFTLPLLENTESFSMKVTNRGSMDESFASMVTIRAIEYKEPSLLANWNETRDALQIGLNSEFDGENTKFHLTLTPNKGMSGVSIPLDIPKCMAEYAAEMNLQGNYHIVKDDPLIVWQFEELNQPTSIEFSVPKNVDEECKAQLKAMAMARRIGKPINPWLSLLLIPIIGAILIFFQRFTPETKQHKAIPKKEYFGLGRAQGMTEEDLEREWHDYKRRFRQ